MIGNFLYSVITISFMIDRKGGKTTDILYNWIKNIVVYMILNTIIMNLLGNNSYKKYISIVSGMILVLIVVSPLFSLLHLDKKLDYFMQFNDFAIETSDFKNNLNTMDKKQSDAIFKEFQNKVKKQVKNILIEEKLYLKSFQLNFDRNPERDTFGEIKSMILTAVYQKKGNNIDENNKIEIERIDINKDNDKSLNKIPSPVEIRVKNKLSDFYNIKPANINISIQGG